MTLFAVHRLARSEPEAAAQILRGKLAERLPPADVAYLWGRVAYEAARRHVSEANRWFVLADPAQMSDEQLAWRARAALRAGLDLGARRHRPHVGAGAAGRGVELLVRPRARRAGTGRRRARLFPAHLRQPNFYGLLAAEELGAMAGAPEPFTAAEERDVEAARANPALARALELYRLELRGEVTREWAFSIRGMDDARLLGGWPVRAPRGHLSNT